MPETPGQKYRREKAEAARAAAEERYHTVEKVGKHADDAFDELQRECEEMGHGHEYCIKYAFEAADAIARGKAAPPLKGHHNRRHLGLSGGTRKGKARKGRKSYRKRK